jgi:hypothetical protein
LDVFEKRELHIIKFDNDGDEKARRAAQRDESRRRYVGELTTVLVELGLGADDAVRWAESVFDRLFVVPRRRDTTEDEGEPCFCSCHPRVPTTDLHDYGFDCPCQQTPDERRRSWDEWRAGMDEYWDSAEGRALRAEREAEEDELVSWLAGHPDVAVRSYGGAAPEQWWGSVDGHSFYFRERHAQWRIELDLRPSGRSYRAWKGGDLDDDASYEMKESEEGEEIAQGTIHDAGYGRTPVERIEFLVRAIRDHLRRQSCELHTVHSRPAESDAERPPTWCPVCGTRS